MLEEPAIQVLGDVLARLRAQPAERSLWDPARVRAYRQTAVTRYGALLTPEGVAGLDRETFLGFLRAENLRHRMGFGRVESLVTDMAKLKAALAVLVDERRPLRERLDHVRPAGNVPIVRGLGPGLITLILHFVGPDRYGIMNGTSERSLHRIGLFPDLAPSASLAERYEAVNPVLVQTAAALGIDLGLLDALWWRIQSQDLAKLAALRAKNP